MNVNFTHGKESGPWGTKIEALAEVARVKGFSVEIPDYSKQPDPDARVEQLLNLRFPASDLTVLVGSSMGGYVATLASHIMNPVGLFLMAPAFYLPGYKEQNPIPHARKTVIVHGLKDDIVPVENSIRFAREHNTELHLVDSDHGLISQLPKIEILFDMFLDDVIELSDLPKILTWEKIAQKYGEGNSWVAGIWRKMVSAGHANYKNESERIDVLLRFIALTEFCSEFLSIFSRDSWGIDPKDIAETFELPKDTLNNLLADFVAKHGNESKESTTIEMALSDIARNYVYPDMLQYYGGLEGVATSIYTASYPTYFEEDTDQYLVDPEDLDAEEIVKLEVYKNIIEWLNYKFEQEDQVD